MNWIRDLTKKIYSWTRCSIWRHSWIHAIRHFSSIQPKVNALVKLSVSGETHDLFWACFEEAADVATNSTEQQTAKNPAAAEINHYLSSTRVHRSTNPYTWWEANKKTFPILTKLACTYLSTPSSSVYSERLFSEAGLVYEKKRNRLDPTRAEKLVFLHHKITICRFWSLIIDLLDIQNLTN